MNSLPKENRRFLIVSLSLIVSGFLCMKLESSPHGDGPLELTVAPLLIVSGYVIGLVSLFYRTVSRDYLRKQMPFLIVGWATFFGAFIIYLLTLEETASLWDCAEFIACAYKLQVPHAPGAPLFLMIDRLFSLLAFGDTLKVAYWVNVTSALSSAFAVMFTFWAVIMLCRRIKSSASNFSLIMAGMMGGFTIAFSDSFWYSAVEAETYAMATLFLIICFWAMLKWDQAKKSKLESKWLIFIFYMLGLSVGVHPMSLLVLPALAILFMFKRKDFSWRHLIMAISGGAISILFLNQVILFGLSDAMKYADIFCVNVLGMPFYSGVIMVTIGLIAAGLLIYRWAIKRQNRVISTMIVGLMYFLIGYSSYFMIIIRSQADPAIDENNPENIISLASYLKRESYGSRPLVYGPNFDAQVKAYKKGKPVYSIDKEKYKIADHPFEYEYDKADMTILPRMYSIQADHIKTYREWTGLKRGEKPGLADNIKFMFRYQFGHMYFRYLMFNFVGRASDFQHADWLTPADIFVKIPEALKENKARNNFLMLPLLLGILGLFYQYSKEKVGFWSVMAFFLFLGFILVFYLNATPNEPRERDYIYVGSYLAFSVWCGIGSFGIIQFLTKKMGKNPWSEILGSMAIIIPIIMLVVGYNDHDRSGRTLQIDHARNTLASCEPDAILFTGGDNDTFPLWYVQEVEGYRTDVRVIILSYFNAEWYIKQMKQKVNESAPLPLSLEDKHFRQGGLNDILPYTEKPGINRGIDLERFLELIREGHRAIQVSMSGGATYNAIPSRTFFLKIDPGIVSQLDDLPLMYQDYIPPRLTFSWSGNYMQKNELMLLDLINTNKWERPIYFNLTSLNSLSLNLKKHVLQEGSVYRLYPIELHEEGEINSNKMYTNLMEKSVYRDIHNEKVYYNHEDFQLRILQNILSNYAALARALFKQQKINKAEKVVTFACREFLGENKSTDISTLSMIEILFQLGKKEEALRLADNLYVNANEFLDYYINKPAFKDDNSQLYLFILGQLYTFGVEYNQPGLAEKCATKFNFYYSSR